MINKDVMTQLRYDIDTALAAIGKNHGLTLKTGNGTWDFGGQTARYTVNIAVPGTSKDHEDLRLNYPEYVDKEITLGDGKRYKVVGLAPRGTSFIVTQLANGKRYKVKHLAVTRQLGAKSNATIK